jgi:hypothetical protein
MVFICVAVMRVHRIVLMGPGSPSTIYQRLSIVDAEPILALALDMVACVEDEM